MKILHTSDWHIGRSLYGRKRYDEFAAFLEWLSGLIRTEAIDLLLISGDIFDNTTPGNRAQELYYRFLCQTAASPCRHVVVIAGNHDSPSFLNAPKELLKVLNVHVVGSVTENLDDEVLVLHGESGEPEIIVCAVPYLRDRDIRKAEAGESINDKHMKLIQGMRKHYGDICDIAQKKREHIQQTLQEKQQGEAINNAITIPIAAMGHLFTAGGKTVDGDGVRELYVGTLAHVGTDAFPSCIDYCALGHLHVPQRVGKMEHIRYCGSPIPMGYGEAKQEKKVIVVDFNISDSRIVPLISDSRIVPMISEFRIVPLISEVTVPCFQTLERISGTLEEITTQIETLKLASSRAWLEIEYTGNEIAANLRESLDQAVENSQMEILKVKNRRMAQQVMSRVDENETLDNLNEDEVFLRCMDHYNITEDERSGLIQSYQEILSSLHEEDLNAE